MKKRFGWLKKIIFGFLGLTAIAIAVAFYIGVYQVAPPIILHPYKPDRAVFCNDTPERHGLMAERFDFKTEEGFTLKGWYVHAAPGRPPRGTVVCLHGIGGCKEPLLGDAELVSKEGFNAILYDSRAQGESGGENCTFGYFEARDLSRALDEAAKRHGAAQPYGVWGGSFGGAVALRALAHEPRLKFGIVVSTFASLREIVGDYLYINTGVRANLIANLALNKAGHIAGFPPEEVAPAEDAKRITQPILLIHGMDDRNISVEYGKRIFANLASKDKHWYPVPGADHFNVWEKGGAEYDRQLRGFLRRVSP
jgi:uncharacterized protein